MDKGLYIHIPFCIRKCRYCDFPSYTGMESLFDSYLDALLVEAKLYKGEKIDTVFIGGGTPSILSCEQIKRLLVGIRDNFQFSENIEFSVEVNPGTLTEEKLAALKDGGVNRLSIGVQSFSDSELQIIGRIHDGRVAAEAVELSKKYFDNINIDIMTALPGQTADSLEKTLDTAISLGVTHISCYSLILEEGTELYNMVENGQVTLAGEEEDRQMYSLICNKLKSAGYEHYEISNFAKEGFRCRHNLKYWNTQEYIGLGAAAHSFVGNKRFSNTVNVKDYIQNPIEKAGETELSLSDMMGEYCMMSLRTKDGIDEKEFEKRFGKSFYEVYKNLPDKFISLGLMKKNPQGYSLTPRGINVSNSIMCEFLL